MSFSKDPDGVLHCHVVGIFAAAFLFLNGSAVCLLRTRESWKCFIRLRGPKRSRDRTVNGLGRWGFRGKNSVQEIDKVSRMLAANLAVVLAWDGEKVAPARTTASWGQIGCLAYCQGM